MRALKILPSFTNREEKSIEKYFNEISKYPVLSIEEEQELFGRKDQDPAVLDIIVKHNLRFVVSVAKKYQDCGLPLVDLINEGNLGLMKAAERFDVTRGFKFISYAVWWIRQSIIAALSQHGKKIRTPLNMQSDYNSIRKAKTLLVQQLEREPSLEELSEILNMDISKIRQISAAHKKCASLDAVVNEDSRTTMIEMMVDHDVQSPDEHLTNGEGRMEEIKTMLRVLPQQQAMIIKDYYGIDRPSPASLGEIADRLGLSRERVRQLRDHSLNRLRKFRNTYLAVES